jgi:Domain of unknown function (DUF4112)
MTRPFTEPTVLRSFESARVARNLERVAWLMDRAIGIPGTRISFGLDALLGLIPLGGDVLTGMVQLGLVLVALKHYHVPKSVAARMLRNVLVDVVVGEIPLLGDLFDVAFKANTRNLKLLEPYRHTVSGDSFGRTPVEVGEHTSARPERPVIELRLSGTVWRYILLIGVILGTGLVLMIVGLVTLVGWLVRHPIF